MSNYDELQESQPYSPSMYRGQYSSAEESQEESADDGWVSYTPSNDSTMQVRNGFGAVSLSDGPNEEPGQEPQTVTPPPPEPHSPPPPPPADSDIDEESDTIEDLPVQDGTVGNPIDVENMDILNAIQLFRNVVESLKEQVKEPVTHAPFEDPWIATDGHTYDLETIRGCPASPLTRDPNFHPLRPNLFVKQTVELYKTNLKKLNDIIRSLSHK